MRHRITSPFDSAHSSGLYDIIRIADGEQVPADCVLLKVADDKPECFVSTSPLDGERNLKYKSALKITSEAIE